MALIFSFVAYALFQLLSLHANIAYGQNTTSFAGIANNFGNFSRALANAQTVLGLTTAALQGCLGEALSGIPLVPLFSDTNPATNNTNTNNTGQLPGPGLPAIPGSGQLPAVEGLRTKSLMKVTERAVQTLYDTQQLLKNTSALLQHQAGTNTTQLQARLDLGTLVSSCVNGLLGLVSALLALVLALVAAILALVASLLAFLAGNPALGRLLAPLQGLLQQLASGLVPGLQSSMGGLEQQASATSNCIRNLLAPLRLTGVGILPQQPVTIGDCLARLDALGSTVTQLSATLTSAASLSTLIQAQISRLSELI